MKAHFSTAIRPLVDLLHLVRFVRLARLANGSALALCLGLGLGFGLAGPAHAVDGCKLLLCMAGNWQNISQCEPTVRQALRDAARGRGWPSCNMGGDSASGNQYVAPEQCPEQYRTSTVDWRDRLVTSCPFSGVIHVAVEGQPWSRTWWSPSGDSVVEWLPAAKLAFASRPGAMDDRFDRDRAAWVATSNMSGQVRPAAEAADGLTRPAAASQGGGG